MPMQLRELSLRRAGGWLVRLACAALPLLCGCTSVREYFQNGFLVGPNYQTPTAPVAKEWIDADDRRVSTGEDDLRTWWTVFNDPVLDNLIDSAYRQNLTLRAAGFRVLQARAQVGISAGNLFPQTQQMTGDFRRQALSEKTTDNFLQVPIPGIKRFYNQWDAGFNLEPGARFLGPVPPRSGSGRRQPGRLR